MDLRRFITLKTVVEEGSFLRASQKLCCTQSTVTFHIQQLEQEFSVQLFEKIGRRMCLTREGKKLLPHIYELTRVMDTLREAAKKESDPDGELRVVSGETLLSYRMPQHLGLSAPGDRTAAKIEKLLAWLETLKAELGIPKSIREAGVQEADFLANVDKLSEDAFDDQCTGANPRYPLISELKQILLDTYYGRDYVEGETAAKKEAAPAKAEKKAKKSA